MPDLHTAQDEQGDRLLADRPLALRLGMALDQPAAALCSSDVSAPAVSAAAAAPSGGTL